MNTFNNLDANIYIDQNISYLQQKIMIVYAFRLKFNSSKDASARLECPW